MQVRISHSGEKPGTLESPPAQPIWCCPPLHLPLFISQSHTAGVQGIKVNIHGHTHSLKNKSPPLLSTVGSDPDWVLNVPNPNSNPLAARLDWIRLPVAQGRIVSRQRLPLA